MALRMYCPFAYRSDPSLGKFLTSDNGQKKKRENVRKREADKRNMQWSNIHSLGQILH